MKDEMLILSENEKCPNCKKGIVKFGKMEDFGIKPFQSGYCYYCSNCKNYVGTHRKDYKKPLGTLGDGKTRHLRKICHDEFDKFWETSTQKNIRYHMLAKAMDITDEECHFGLMQKDDLIRALNIMGEWES